MPELVKNYNPNIFGVLVDLASTSQGDYDYLLMQAQGLFNEGVSVLSRKVSIPLKFLLKQEVSMRRMLLRLSFESLVFDLNQLSFSHILDLEDMIINRPQGSVVHWPKGVKVLKTGKELVFRS